MWQQDDNLIIEEAVLSNNYKKLKENRSYAIITLLSEVVSLLHF